MNFTKVKQELEYAYRAGFTFLRIFAHNLAFEADGNFSKLEHFIALAHRVGIPYIMPVIFDGCGSPPGVCNATNEEPTVASYSVECWLASPGWQRQNDESHWNELEAYVEALGKWFE